MNDLLKSAASTGHDLTLGLDLEVNDTNAQNFCQSRVELEVVEVDEIDSSDWHNGAADWEDLSDEEEKEKEKEEQAKKSKPRAVETKEEIKNKSIV